MIVGREAALVDSASVLVSRSVVSSSSVVVVEVTSVVDCSSVVVVSPSDSVVSEVLVSVVSVIVRVVVSESPPSGTPTGVSQSGGKLVHCGIEHTYSQFPRTRIPRCNTLPPSSMDS